MSEGTKIAAIWASAITVMVVGFMVLVYQGVETSQQNKITCIQNGGTWIGGGGHCIQQGGSNDG